MKVSLLAITKPVHDGIDTPEQLLAYCARVSSTANQMNHASGPKLLRFLMKRKEWSPLEMVNLVMEIEVERDIARQILRHQFKFQEMCVSGDTMVTFDVPAAVKRGKRQPFKRPISELYEMQQAGKALPSMARVFDETRRIFTNAPIREVFQTGVKPTFRVTLENGRKIECTKEHRFLTDDGFLPLEDAIGLRLVGSTAVMSRPDTMLACNGVPAYKDQSWLARTKAKAIEDGTGLLGIADAAGVSSHTIRKWLRMFGLQFTKADVASYSPIWNKGVRGYKRRPHSPETISKIRASARRGPDSNLWRGGANRAERLRIADWCASNRTGFLRAANYKCQRCGSNHRLEMHHIETVVDRPELAYEPTNIEVLCRLCHREHHNINGDTKVWRERSAGNTLTAHWSKVRHVEYVGEQMTYDLEVEHTSHNFVANGIVVHNSQRYARVLSRFTRRRARLQDHRDRQNSIETDELYIQLSWSVGQWLVAAVCGLVYRGALHIGIAKEVARSVLPEGMTMSRMYVNGYLRNWIHFCEARCDGKTQKEHREVAFAVKAILEEQFPALRGLIAPEQS